MRFSLKNLFRHKENKRKVTNVQKQGRSVVAQKSLICGRGGIRFGRAAQLGWRLSPMLHATAMYFEVRNQDSIIEIGLIAGNPARLVRTITQD